MDVIPWYYYYFFGGLEPVLEVVGTYLCLWTPQVYVKDLLPPKVERSTTALGGTMRGRIACGALGSYFFTFSLIASVFFPLARRLLKDRPHTLERLTRGYLAVLAICDIQHIAVTLLPMPRSLLQNPQHWTVSIHGNISITIALFTVRALWFLGVGRVKPVEPPVSKTPPTKVSPAGIPTAFYYLFSVIEPIILIAGALYILLLPHEYGKALLPERYERVTSVIGSTVRGQMVLGGLGSSLILTSLVQLTMFPLIRSALADDAHAARQMVYGLLGPLAVCDLLHAAMTFYPLPASLSDSPSRWTFVMQLNVIGKLVFLLSRVLCFAGGETDAPVIHKKNSRKGSKEQASGAAGTATSAKEGLQKRGKKVVS